MVRFGHSVLELEQRRRNQITATISALGLVLLICVSILFFLSTGKSTHSLENAAAIKSEHTEFPTLEVYVAIKDIDTGERLNQNLFRKQSMLKAALFGYSQITDIAQVEGQYSRSLILKGQPVFAAHLSAKKGASELERLLPPGYRAVTIPVDARSAVEGWVRPNSQVDVNWIYPVNHIPTAIPLIQNAKVLSVERSTQQNMEAEARIPSTVTLQVFKQDAPRLQLALNQGSIFLSLRGADESGAVSEYSPVTLQNLLGLKPVEQLKPKDVIVITQPNGQKVKFRLDQQGNLEPLLEEK